MDAFRVNDLLRGSSLRDGEEAVRGMSALLRITLGVVVGATVLGAQWIQASLPVRCGVQGVRETVKERMAARMAAAVDFVSRGAAAIGLGSDRHVMPTDSKECVAAMRARLGDIQPLVEWVGNLTAMLEAGQEFSSQRWWGFRGQEALGTVRDQVRFACQQRPQAGAWLVSVPCVATRTLLPTEHFRGASSGDVGGAPVLPVSGANGRLG